MCVSQFECFSIAYNELVKICISTWQSVDAYWLFSLSVSAHCTVVAFFMQTYCSEELCVFFALYVLGSAVDLEVTLTSWWMFCVTSS